MASELSEARRLAVDAYETGLARYRAEDWDAAEAAFRECLAKAPGDRPSAVMLARVDGFRKAPPGTGWEGVWVAGSK